MKTGYIFPGQGSQSVGMLNELASTFDTVEQTYKEASEALGYDLWKLVNQGPDVDLNQTHHTQPALLAAGVAVWRVLQEKAADKPVILAGHSLGEYTALVCADAIEFKDAVTLVADRGRYMQEAVPAGKGAMAAILGLEDELVAEICATVSQGEIVSCANYNSPGQIVIAGQTAAVERAVEALKAAGAKRSVVLPVSVPSHCALMKPAADALRKRLESITIRSPLIPVIHNVDAKIRTSTEEIADALVEQLYQPVRWVDVMQTMAQQVDQVIECGPGKVLAGLSKRIDRELVCSPVYDTQTLEKVLS